MELNKVAPDAPEGDWGNRNAVADASEGGLRLAKPHTEDSDLVKGTTLDSWNRPGALGIFRRAKNRTPEAQRISTITRRYFGARSD